MKLLFHFLGIHYGVPKFPRSLSSSYKVLTLPTSNNLRVNMASHPTKKDIYGPGTFTDVDFTPVPQECTRILHHLAETTPGFTTDPAILDNVHFHGADYPIIPGPLKSQVFVRDTHTTLFSFANLFLGCCSSCYGRYCWQ